MSNRWKWVLFILVTVLICVINNVASGQEVLNYTFGDLVSAINSTTNTPKKTDQLIKLAQFYYTHKINSEENLNRSLHYAESAYSLASGTGDSLLISRANQVLAAAQLRTGHTLEVLRRHDRSTGLVRSNIALAIGEYYLYRAGELKIHLDSAERYLLEVKNLAIKSHNVYQENEADYYLSDILYERGDLLGSKDNFIATALRSEKVGDYYHAAESYSRWGDHIAFNEASEKLKYYSLAKNIYTKNHNKTGEVNLLKAIGDIHFNMGQLDLSEKEEKAVANWYESNGYKNLQDVYFLLSAISRTKGNLNDALKYGMTAVEYSKRSGADINDGYFFNTLAEIYGDLGKEDESIKWYIKTVDVLHRNNSEVMYNSLKNLSEYYFKRGETRTIINLLNSLNKNEDLSKLDRQLIAAIKGNGYLYEKNYTAAEKSYQEMIKWESLNNLHTYHTADAYLTIANFYLNRENFEKADYYLRYILTLAPNTFPISKLKDVYFYLAKADSARGYNALALRDYKTFRQLNDSIFTQEKNHQIQELMIKYDVRQKEKDYDILRKQTQIQKAELQKAQLLTKITIAGIMLLLLATALLYAYIRNRRRSESLLSQHQDEITRKNLSLENLINKQNKLIKDKEWLIKEIHHRVKNNLQVVMSLLNTQMQYIDNALVVSALTDSQTRLYSISLIHQKLFQNDQVAFVEIRPYIIELIKFLHETFHFEDKIRFDYDIEELNLDITHAIPLGLIINEAITNAIKYAFPNNRKGNVTLSLKSAEGDNYELIIKDNGIGLRPDFKPQLSQTLGMVLMRGLSSQLGGDIKVINSTGVQVNLLFPQIMPEEAEIELLDDENLKNI